MCCYLLRVVYLKRKVLGPLTSPIRISGNRYPHFHKYPPGDFCQLKYENHSIGCSAKLWVSKSQSLELKSNYWLFLFFLRSSLLQVQITSLLYDVSQALSIVSLPPLISGLVYKQAFQLFVSPLSAYPPTSAYLLVYKLGNNRSWRCFTKIQHCTPIDLTTNL